MLSGVCRPRLAAAAAVPSAGARTRHRVAAAGARSIAAAGGQRSSWTRVRYRRGLAHEHVGWAAYTRAYSSRQTEWGQQLLESAEDGTLRADAIGRALDAGADIDFADADADADGCASHGR